VHGCAELLRHFTDTAGAKGEDAVALQVACACNLPEVTAAVGWGRWEALKPALVVLASAPEAATRAALAGNLHRLAEVLPEEMAADVLLPTTEVCGSLESNQGDECLGGDPRIWGNLGCT